MSAQHTNTIDAFGDPLAFKVRQGTTQPTALRKEPATDMFKVEARYLRHHKKEAVVAEGASRGAWRIASDEGPAPSAWPEVLVRACNTGCAWLDSWAARG